MAEAIRGSRPSGAGRHRADEIGVHHREWWESAWPLLALLAALAVGLLAFWAYGRSRATAPDLRTTVNEPARPEMNAPAPGGPMMGAPGIAGGTDVVCDAVTIHFDSNGSTLDEGDKGSIETLAECLKSNPDQSVRLEGRADPRESLSRDSAIAQARAEAVASELTSLGVPASQISVITSATTCSESDEECWQQDRSVTVVPLR
jgi:outer membrane protein OmpA-like peptidoglycan-associated protein